jgi:hypothetical protein
VSDHRHEPYDIYGTAATSGEVGHLESAVAGLRQDLAAAEDRIGELENDLRDALERTRALEDRQPDYASAEESRDDPDEPSNRELEPEPPGWYDLPAAEEVL